jgi:DNA-directed RNA polymerase subunit RPC12/RpoP
MQEDVLGTRRTAVPGDYVLCAKCGKPTPIRDSHAVESDVLDETLSEFEYICPDCWQALAMGEKDLPIT